MFIISFDTPAGRKTEVFDTAESANQHFPAIVRRFTNITVNGQPYVKPEVAR